MKKGSGIAEETVGRWLQRSGHRDDIVLATKVYQPMGLGANDRRLSAYHIRRARYAAGRRLPSYEQRRDQDPAATPTHHGETSKERNRNDCNE